MLLTEYDEAKAMELFKEEGREEGREEGLKEGEERATKRLYTLFQNLLCEGRTEDAMRVTYDSQYRDKLIDEFQLA